MLWLLPTQGEDSVTASAQCRYLQSQYFQKSGGEIHMKLLGTEFPQWKECELAKFLFFSVAKKWGKVFILNNKKLQGLDLWLNCLYFSEHILCVGFVLILVAGEL